MDQDLIRMIIINAPNFIGFIIALLIAERARQSEKERADRLLQSFIDCQDDRVREEMTKPPAFSVRGSGNVANPGAK